MYFTSKTWNYLYFWCSFFLQYQVFYKGAEPEKKTRKKFNIMWHFRTSHPKKRLHRFGSFEVKYSSLCLVYISKLNSLYWRKFWPELLHADPKFEPIQNHNLISCARYTLTIQIYLESWAQQKMTNSELATDSCLRIFSRPDYPDTNHFRIPPDTFYPSLIRLIYRLGWYPTSPLAILEPQNPDIG